MLSPAPENCGYLPPVESAASADLTRGGNMQRYLIRHDEAGTWDLIIEGDVMSVEHAHRDQRRRIGLAAFEQSETGEQLAEQLASALQRAGRIA
jgi:hypothetical protein